MSDRPVGLVIAVGAAAGFLAGLFGVGGGILIVPGLVFAAHLNQRLAHGTSLAAVLPISVASMATYAMQGNLDWPVAALLSVGSVAGVVLGTAYLHVADPRTLRCSSRSSCLARRRACSFRSTPKGARR